MLSLFPIAASCGILATGIALRKKPQNTKLVTALAGNQSMTTLNQQSSGLQKLKAEITKSCMDVDDRYQRFVQAYIDPLLGKTRHAQLQEMLSDESFELDPDERFANRRLGMGILSLSLSLLGTWLYAPLMPLAILVGFTASTAKYPMAYREWQRTKRVGAIHLFCIYGTYLWLGGYATVGSLGAILFGLTLKAKAISENRSRNNLVNIFQLQPDKVWVRANGNEIEVPFEQINIGDTLVVQAGQIMPVDGTIVAGAATIDQHMLTGEAQPVEKSSGDDVLAATLLISGQVDIRVEKTSTETTAGQIAEILNQSSQEYQSADLQAMAMADSLALPTLALSIVSLPFIGAAGAISLTGANSTYATYLSSSLALLNFLNLAANRSILIKDANSLEQLTQIDTIVFDKTGTLTLEQPHVVQVHVFNSVQVADVLTLAAAAEARQTHPIARAIMTAAAEIGVQPPAINEAHYEVGYGIKVRLEDVRATGQTSAQMAANGVLTTASPLIRVGSGRYMDMEGIARPEEVQDLSEACQAKGHSLVMVAVDEDLVGCIELQPTVRPEAHGIIQGLKAQGLDLYIISGDQEAPTRQLAQDLGMSGYFANTLPEAKADLVAQLQAEGRNVCFIGDGINDAIAMRQAEVSISLRGATTAATDTAQVILMEGNLNKLVYIFELADEFERNLKHNLRFTAGVSTIAISGILLAGFTFAATEILFTASLIGGLTIAMQPLLNYRKDNDEASA